MSPSSSYYFIPEFFSESWKKIPKVAIQHVSILVAGYTLKQLARTYIRKYPEKFDEFDITDILEDGKKQDVKQQRKSLEDLLKTLHKLTPKQRKLVSAAVSSFLLSIMANKQLQKRKTTNVSETTNKPISTIRSSPLFGTSNRGGASGLDAYLFDKLIKVLAKVVAKEVRKKLWQQLLVLLSRNAMSAAIAASMGLGAVMSSKEIAIWTKNTLLPVLRDSTVQHLWWLEKERVSEIDPSKIGVIRLPITDWDCPFDPTLKYLMSALSNPNYSRKDKENFARTSFNIFLNSKNKSAKKILIVCIMCGIELIFKYYSLEQAFPMADILYNQLLTALRSGKLMKAMIRRILKHLMKCNIPIPAELMQEAGLFY